MAYLHCEETKYTPEVRASEEEAYLSLRGNCFPEDAVVFFEPIMSWIADYFTTKNRTLAIYFALKYINTSTQRRLTELIEILNMHYNDDHNIRAEWQFLDVDDIDEQEAVEDFRDDAVFPFTVKG